MCDNELLAVVKENIGTFQDFPKSGVVFRNPKAFDALCTLLQQHVGQMTTKPEVVVGLDARGFLIGPIIALREGIPFVPVRKSGKLPGKVLQERYELEYDTATLEVQCDSIVPGQKVLIVDDLLASGGSLNATSKLVRKLQADVVECLVIIELKHLKGRKLLDVPVYSLIQY